MSETDLAAVARDVFGLDASVTRLPGEHDENARLDLADGTTRLLKLHRADAADGDIDFQDEVLRHLERCAPALVVPRLLGSATHHGRTTRLLSWTPGTVWAASPSPPEELRRSLGAEVARIDRALVDFDHDLLDRTYRWNMLQAERVHAACGESSDPAMAWARRTLADFAESVLPKLSALPMQAIHNDANDHNVLIGAHTDVHLIDYGDVVRSPRIVGLAVAVAYSMLGTAEPLAAALPVVGGYHTESPLEPEEIVLLDALVRTRLAMSVANAARQIRDNPGNAEYLSVSQAPVRAVVVALSEIAPAFALYSYRDACGLRPIPQRDVDSFLDSRKCNPAAIVDADLTNADVQDWSVGTTSHMQAIRDHIVIGRYREERSVYTTDAFATSAPDGERRTVHLGIDVFVPPGTTVYAPLDGVVHTSEYRSERGDYGGVVLLEQQTETGLPFWLLIGHLSRASAALLAAGRRVARGEPIAAVGERNENGGWPPHIHVQLYLDLLGRSTDLPGVVRRSQLDVWEAICPNPSRLVRGLVPGLVEAPRELSQDEIATRRSRNLSATLSLSYRTPLHIVRGEGAELIDAAGDRWLDLVNNVCHVGHSHPRVVGALSSQAAILNTNTRYLHPAIVEYARRLLATFPDPLSVVFFTNSGSEANDLALRLARTATRREHVLALDWAYHGNLTSLIEISAYKFNRAGGTGPGPRVRVCELPDPYRGRFGHDGAAYADHVAAQLRALDRDDSPAAAFIHESIPGCAGQIELASGYLAAAYTHARAAGALCIADEVQCGLGRVGDAMWAFESHDVVPDIVTLGKPLGNGHPLGAVVTTAPVARGFVTGMEYFNTFGGNPVSCATGLAVLDVLRDEQLMANAREVGARLAHGLRFLAERHLLIGDVRGRGLFLGVDLVLDRDSKEPATAYAAGVVEAMKHRGILVSSDGPHDNVLKIKPPMVLCTGEVDRVLVAFDEAFSEVN